MTVTTSANWKSLSQKDLSLVFMDQLHGFSSMLPYVVGFKKAGQGIEYDLLTTGFSLPQIFNGAAYYDQPVEGYKSSIQETEYTLGFIYTRKLARNDLYGVIRERVAGIADMFRYLRETIGASPFVNAFNGSFTVGDTLSLCNAAHTSITGQASQSNTNSLALSAANLESNRVSMTKFKDDRGILQTIRPDMLLVPEDLAQTAYEIVASMGKVDTANNNRNYQEGRYKIVVWQNFLTSANNWFLCDSRLLKQRMLFREWEAPTFMSGGDIDTITTKKLGYMSCGISSAEWRGVFGSSN